VRYNIASFLITETMWFPEELLAGVKVLSIKDIQMESWIKIFKQRSTLHRVVPATGCPKQPRWIVLPIFMFKKGGAVNIM